MENKLVLEESTDESVIICAENEDILVAEMYDCTAEIPETKKRAERIVECYNLFVGVENPTEYLKSLER